MNSSSIPYQKSLDGIRGLAILLVMLRHQQIITFGCIGAQLCFILSGYLITRILITEKEVDPL
jgi:peptidoglycan/LPS O-acetylase OafA/YrhL